MSLLEVQNLAFAYGSHQVFSQVSFSVEPGQIFCLAGPNGCGKTTLEHCILAHEKPQAGTILIGGKPLESYSSRALAAQIAYVPQNHTRSFPYLAVDVVAMGFTRTQKLLETKGSQRNHALSVMESLGIEHLAEVEYTTLSGGELQLVLVARALAQHSKLLVLDEPVAHLDIKRTQHILKLLARLSREQGLTIIISTHDFNHPLQLEDEGAEVRMALMNQGTLEQAAPPLELLSSNALEAVYGIQSRIMDVSADKTRHFLAAWDEGK